MRAADEIRAGQFPSAEGELDLEMVAIARAIIVQRTDKFDPSTCRDRYQEALRELVEAKVTGLPIKPREVSAPAPVIDLMAALKRSLMRKAPAKSDRTKAQKRAKAVADRRQPSLLLGVSGGRRGRGSLLSSRSDARRLERRRLARQEDALRPSLCSLYHCRYEMLDRWCPDFLHSIARFFAKDLEDALDTRLTERTEAPEVGPADTYGFGAYR